ncbi:hypothetical protein T484DRAFT_1922139 [Baffinella frigidus]|nr:hypothetical protein T484DRAFT_1922139 [Cryptophyta sp. CCMP2293]
MKRCRSVESESNTPLKCARLIPARITNNPARRRSSAVEDAIETMLEEEQEDAHRSTGLGADFFASMSEHAREVRELRVAEARRQGVSILYMVAAHFNVDTSTEAFALAVALLERCLKTLKLTEEQRGSLELPLVCFQISLKFTDGCPPLLSDLSSCITGVVVHTKTVGDLEIAVLDALKWRVGTVTAAQIIREALSLSPASLREQWRSSLHFHIELYHKTIPSDSPSHRPSATVSALIGIVAHKAGYDAEALESWLPPALMPPLQVADSLRVDDATFDTPSGGAGGGVGGDDAARRARETLWVVRALRGALALSEPDVIEREASTSPPLWITGGGVSRVEWA